MRIPDPKGDTPEGRAAPRTHGPMGAQLSQPPRLAGRLKARLFRMVEVSVAEGMNEVPRLKPSRLRHHVGRYGMGGDAEGISHM